MAVPIKSPGRAPVFHNVRMRHENLRPLPGQLSPAVPATFAPAYDQVVWRPLLGGLGADALAHLAPANAPIPTATLARRLRVGPTVLEEALARAAYIGRIRLGTDGSVVAPSIGPLAPPYLITGLHAEARAMAFEAERQVRLEAAAAYVAAGHPVLACVPGAKAPLGSACPHGLLDATLDTDVIATWLARSPVPNLAIRTGVGCDVVDFDRLNIPELDEARLHLGTVAARTPRGLHVLVPPDPERPRRSRVGVRANIDLRAEGGYIVVAPSDVSLRRYGWLSPDRKPITPAEAMAIPLVTPTWLTPILAPTPAAAPPLRVLGPGPSAGREGRWAAAALADEARQVGGARDGYRNHRLNLAAWRLGGLVPTGLLGAGEVASALLGAALAAGLGESEARRTIDSGMSAGAASPRNISALGPAAPAPALLAPGRTVARGPTPPRSAPSLRPEEPDPAKPGPGLELAI